jgi:hypothetical protein
VLIASAPAAAPGHNDRLPDDGQVGDLGQLAIVRVIDDGADRHVQSPILSGATGAVRSLAVRPPTCSKLRVEPVGDQRVVV